MVDFVAVSAPPPTPLEAHVSPARVAWLLLMLATLYFSYFSQLGAIGLAGPDEPRYAWIARDMAETGDWVTPRLYGKPWFEKPILYYWGAALSFKVFGVSEAAARLPSALSALLGTLALAWLAWRRYGVSCARWVLLLLPTSVGMLGFSHAAATDMPFSGMLTVALVCAAAAMGLADAEAPAPLKTRRAPLTLFGFFLGLAALAKGPAAVILAGGAALPFAVFTKRWRDAFRLLHPIAIASFLLTALPWYLLCAHRNPDFFHVFIIEHNFKRYLTSEFQHIQPVWFYGPILIFALFPWVVLSMAAVYHTVRKQLGMDLGALPVFLLSWSGFTVFFFSISKSKLPGYILPAIPPLIFFAARCLDISLQRDREAPVREIGMLALTPLLFVAGTSIVLYLRFKGVATPLFALSGAALALGGIGASVAYLVKRQRTAAFLAGLIVWTTFLALTTHLELPWLDPVLSPRPVARILNERPHDSIHITAFRLQRGWQYALNFYLHRELQEWTPNQGGAAIVLASPRGIDELRKRKITFEVMDRTCIQAQLIRIGGQAPSEPPASTPSLDSSGRLRLDSVGLPPLRRQS